MKDKDLRNIIQFIDAKHNPWGVFIKYQGHSYIDIDPAGMHQIQTYDFMLSGGMDYILSVGTQARRGESKNGSQTIFSLRDADDHLAGDDFGYNAPQNQQVNVSVTGAWNFHVFEVALELSHTILKGIYIHDPKAE